MQGDDALSSTAALTFSKFVAKSADNLAMKRRSGGRQFKSVLLHISVSRFLEMSENRSKSARVRAICAHAWTRRRSLETRFAGIQQNLSARDFGGSIRRSIGSMGTERGWHSPPNARARNPV